MLFPLMLIRYRTTLNLLLGRKTL